MPPDSEPMGMFWILQIMSVVHGIDGSNWLRTLLFVPARFVFRTRSCLDLLGVESALIDVMIERGMRVQ